MKVRCGGAVESDKCRQQRVLQHGHLQRQAAAETTGRPAALWTQTHAERPSAIADCPDQVRASRKDSRRRSCVRSVNIENAICLLARALAAGVHARPAVPPLAALAGRRQHQRPNCSTAVLMIAFPRGGLPASSPAAGVRTGSAAPPLAAPAERRKHPSCFRLSCLKC